MRRFFPWLVLLAATPLAAAPISSNARTNWEALRAQSPVATAVEWSSRSGVPTAMYGRFNSAGEPSVTAARNFISAQAALLGVNERISELSVQREVDSPLGRHIFFEQRYRGVPVYGGEVSVHFNRAGDIIAVNNTFVPEIRVEVDPSTTAEEAIARARSAVRIEKLRSEPSADLVIYEHQGVAHLAWRVIRPTERETFESFVDAHTLRLLGPARDINRYVDGSGRVFNISAVVATQNNSLTDGNDADSAVPLSAYSTVTLRGLVGNGFLDGPYASSSATRRRASSPSNVFNFERSAQGFSETMGYYYLDYAQRYIQSLGFTNVNNRQQIFSAEGTKKDNSWYTPSDKQLTFGTGGVDDAEDAEVILHEYGHSIQDNQKPGFGSGNEAGAMGEGFGDYWAGSVGAQLSGGFQDACVMEWDATSYSSTNPPCLRRLDSTKKYPADVVNQVHADGQIWSAALWQIRASIGAAKADKLILQHHFVISASSSFNAAANALVTTAINLGYTSGEVSSIRSILQARGFTVTV